MSHLRPPSHAKCHLVLLLEKHAEGVYLASIIKNITRVSELWSRFIEFESDIPADSKSVHTHKQKNTPSERSATFIQKDRVPTQSFSLNFMFRTEVVGHQHVSTVIETLSSKPWRFHHKFQLFDFLEKKVVAKQELYELSPTYPLLAVSPTYQGPSILRINLYVKTDFPTIRSFYSRLLMMTPTHEKHGFCYFSLKSQLGFEVQLSLKFSDQLLVRSTESTALSLSITNLYETICSIGAKFEHIFCSDRGILAIRDPDENVVLVRGSSETCLSPPNRLLSSRDFLYKGLREIDSQYEVARGDVPLAVDVPAERFCPHTCLRSRVLSGSPTASSTSLLPFNGSRAMSKDVSLISGTHFEQSEAYSFRDEERSFSSQLDTDLDTDASMNQSKHDSINARCCTLSYVNTGTEYGDVSSDSDEYSTYSYGDVAYPCCIAYV